MKEEEESCVAFDNFTMTTVNHITLWDVTCIHGRFRETHCFHFVRRKQQQEPSRKQTELRAETGQNCVLKPESLTDVRRSSHTTNRSNCTLWPCK
jgi:hypothetical protein